MKAAWTVVVLLGAMSVGSPAAAQAMRLTLGEALERARKANVLLRANATIIAGARANVARSSPWVPQNPFFSAGLLQSPQTGFGPNYGLTLSQEFEIAGQRRRRIAVAEAGLERAVWDQRSAEVNLVAAVTVAFNDALAGEEQVALAERVSTAVEDVVERAAELEGLSEEAARIDRNQLRIQVVRARRDLEAARRAKATDLDYLRYLLDLPQERSLELIGSISREKRVLPPATELIAAALVHRPDLLALRHDAERAARQISLAKREGVPNVTLSGTLSRFDDSTFAGGDVSLSLPLLRDNEPELLDALAERERAELYVKDLEANIEREVRMARRGCANAGNDLELFLEGILPLARQNVDAQRRRFERGDVGALEMIGILVDGQLAEREALDAAQAYADAWAELGRVVGSDL